MSQWVKEDSINHHAGPQRAGVDGRNACRNPNGGEEAVVEKLR